jgi:Skp family chaperone for outer membrane proteins
MGELLLALLPAIVLVALIWGLFTALSPHDAGMSDAEKYQRDLAERSAQHYAAQVQAATAARARLERSTQPSQNAAQAKQSDLAAARKHIERH